MFLFVDIFLGALSIDRYIRRIFLSDLKAVTWQLQLAVKLVRTKVSYDTRTVSYIPHDPDQVVARDVQNETIYTVVGVERQIVLSPNTQRYIIIETKLKDLSTVLPNLMAIIRHRTLAARETMEVPPKQRFYILESNFFD